MRLGEVKQHWRYTMRAKEFIKESSSGATVSGGIAPVSMPLGAPISRYGFIKHGKYANTPLSVTKKRKIKDARG